MFELHSNIVKILQEPSSDIEVHPARARLRLLNVVTKESTSNIIAKDYLLVMSHSVQAGAVRDFGGFTSMAGHFASSVNNFAAIDSPHEKVGMCVAIWAFTYHRVQLFPSPKWSLFKCLSASRAFFHPPSSASTGQSLQWNLPVSSLRRRIR